MADNPDRYLKEEMVLSTAVMWEEEVLSNY
jgi:hypothetical protein